MDPVEYGTGFKHHPFPGKQRSNYIRGTPGIDGGRQRSDEESWDVSQFGELDPDFSRVILHKLDSLV